MGLSSMTGFARVQGRGEGWIWTWEARSVNGRGLDLRLRLAPGFEALDQPTRKRLGRVLRRGNVSVSLTVVRESGSLRYRINEELLDQVIEALPNLRKRIPEAAPPRLDGLLAIRGVVEQVEELESDEARGALEKRLVADLASTADGLAAMRREEGLRLVAVVVEILDRISELRNNAENLAASQPEALRRRLSGQVMELLDATPALSEQRLAQEAAMLAIKADVREELDRIKAHLAAIRDLLDADEAVGRKMDFLCQELNREANTLCSKSTDVVLTRVGVDLKAAVEQLREQVQNIE